MSYELLFTGRVMSYILTMSYDKDKDVMISFVFVLLTFKVTNAITYYLRSDKKLYVFYVNAL